MPTPIELLQADLDEVSARLSSANQMNNTFSGMTAQEVRQTTRRIFRFAGFAREDAALNGRRIGERFNGLATEITDLTAEKTALEAAITSLGGTPT